MEYRKKTPENYRKSTADTTQMSFFLAAENQNLRKEVQTNTLRAQEARNIYGYTYIYIKNVHDLRLSQKEGIIYTYNNSILHYYNTVNKIFPSIYHTIRQSKAGHI